MSLNQNQNQLALGQGAAVGPAMTNVPNGTSNFAIEDVIGVDGRTLDPAIEAHRSERNNIDGRRVRPELQAFTARPNIWAAGNHAGSTRTRPVNSWMAFRKYYARMLPNLQQRDISPLLAQLWKEDPFKNKWHLIARALSIIREIVGRTKSPLDNFLTIVCPYMQILTYQEYAQRLGWTLVIGPFGDLKFFQDPDCIDRTVFAALGDENYTVGDLVNLSLATGYVDNSSVADVEASLAARGEAGDFDATNYVFMDPNHPILVAQVQQKAYELLLNTIEQEYSVIEYEAETAFNPNLITEANSAIFDSININADVAQDMVNQMIGDGLSAEDSEVISSMFQDDDI
ncbi:MAG: hypothetical protein M1829_001171 [Trizodia sp. TS-e1964]|nr:MAG: hypothetical protein M1829_001171 [Trizodia sp. TS-e1964]